MTSCLLRFNKTRQNQLSTLSRTVDANSNHLNNVNPNNRRRNGSDETLKLDLPPTYEEVMSNSRQATPTVPNSPSAGSGEALQTTTDTHGNVSIEIVENSISQQRNVA